MFMKYRLLVIVFFVLVSACSKPGEETERKAEKGKGDIVIGVALPLNDDRHFLEGVEMAIEDLNEKGGVLGRKIRAIVKDDESLEDVEVNYLIRKGKKIAWQFANDPDVVAVIGHNISDVAVPVSIIYELDKTVFITPFATTPSLTKHGFRFVFRTLPTDTAYARRLAVLAKQKFKNVLIIAVDDIYGESLSNNFHTFAEDLGVNIVGSIHFPSWEDDMKGILMRRANMIEGKKFDDIFDAIFLAAEMPKAARLVKMVRELNITGPFFGGDALDTRELWETAGEDAEGTIVCTTVINEGPTLQKFRERFKEKYGFPPEHWAAHTYDTVQILAYAMETSGSTVPRKIAEALHFIQDWQGVTATFTFDENGDVLNNMSGFKVLSKGEFTYNEELNKLVSEAEKEIAEKEKNGYEAIVEREKRKDVDTMDGDEVDSGSKDRKNK
jgi:branched-chain amino acid transport system substrate-binding protein